ncbi:ATP-binding protein [Oribacterium sp. WCC10]|uniref:ATP-binding protein n=1 Tax=Oribacterium sp. WCC10 TaxID=1855343 RepID=UPI0008EDB3D2|nr:ATP-binding protein [Oribacterium sp. WCC10]SFG53195.1 Response regulator receiver domain-containing protein [Oribacterium sp. WCC10]
MSIFNKNNQKYTDMAQRFGLFMLGIIILFIVFIDFNSYKTYSDVLIRQEETQLLSIARIVGDNLNNYLEQERDKIDVTFAKENGGISDIHSKNKYLIDDSFPLYRGYVLLDDNAEIVDIIMSGTQGTENREKLYEGIKLVNLLKNYRAEIVGKFFSKEDSEYTLYIKKTIRVENKLYTAIYALDMSEIYNRIIKPVQINGAGYIYIRDAENVIIMHPYHDEIGTSGFQSVHENTTGKSDAFDDLFRWSNYQKQVAEGYDVIQSYSIKRNALVPETMIGAFTKLYIQNEEWTVTAFLPMSVLSGPLTQFISIFLLITLIIFLLAVIGTAVCMNIVRQSNEIKYLREINDGMEMIQKQSDEIRNYQRIQSLGMMASHIAHEFNNFLTPVMVYVDLLKTDNDISEENHELLNEMSGSLDQAKQLSTDLLSFARQDTGAKLTNINLREETESALKMVKRLTPHRIKFESEISCKDINLYARKGNIEHILLNLSKNAYDAMENSEKRILRVELKTEGEEAVLMVSDTGCGIPTETIEQIFEPFYTTKGSRQGTGLGLSVVKNIVTSMGGRLVVRSSDEGTTFSMYFPVAEDSGENKTSKIASIKRIAVIYNKNIDIRRIEEIFKGSGVRTEFFDHPAAVISIVEKRKDYFGMIISSYHLPLMNGVETLKIVRRLDPEIRLILTTDEKITEFEWYLNNGYFDRHITVEDLYKELGTLITMNRGGILPRESDAKFVE